MSYSNYKVMGVKLWSVKNTSNCELREHFREGPCYSSFVLMVLNHFGATHSF